MIWILNILGIGLNVWIALTSKTRKHFCVSDKITIGDYTPQCIFAVVLHTIGFILDVFSPGMSFYPVSMWLFILVFSGMYTYKAWRELCRACISTFLLSLLTCVYSIYLLSYIPFYILSSYLLILTIAILVTAAHLK